MNIIEFIYIFHFWLHCAACRVLVPWPGIKPAPLHWKLRALTTGVPVLVVQSCPTLCDPMDSSPPGPSVHWFLQARILECDAMPFSRGSSQFRDQTWVSGIVGRCFTIWGTREAPGKTPIYTVLLTLKKYNFSSQFTTFYINLSKEKRVTQ